MGRKLIYILNHYSNNSSQHFFHVINLLDKIASSGIQIALIIEKPESKPKIANPAIQVFCQQKRSRFGRVTELFCLLVQLQKQGYQKVFIRISWVAAIIAIMVSLLFKLETYYWLSGQGSKEKYLELNWGITKLKMLVSDRIPFWFIKSFIFRFVTGPESMGEYMANVMRVPKEKIIVLYNDIDISRFSKPSELEKAKIKEQLGLPSEKKIILFVHRLSPVRKTLYYIPFIIIEFFKNQSSLEYHFVLAGSGPEESKLREALKNANKLDCITLTGSIPNHQIDLLYKTADIFINPTYAEGFPRVLLEAMACGLPIVTTNAGGTNDIVGERQQEYVIEKEDRVRFSKKLIELSQNEAMQKILTQENLTHVRRYSTEVVAINYINGIFN